jgi:hypothetical protein
MVICWIGNHIMFMLSKLATLMLVTKKPLYVLFVFKTVLLALLQSSRQRGPPKRDKTENFRRQTSKGK